MHLSRFLPRFTVRRLMIAIAILGLLLGVLAERRARFLRIAAWYEREFFPYYRFYFSPQDFHNSKMQMKYEHAARYPWLPVAPDQPEPK